MSSEESGSLADQAAAWVPPWARPSAPAPVEGGRDEADLLEGGGADGPEGGAADGPEGGAADGPEGGAADGPEGGAADGSEQVGAAEALGEVEEAGTTAAVEMPVGLSVAGEPGTDEPPVDDVPVDDVPDSLLDVEAETPATDQPAPLEATPADDPEVDQLEAATPAPVPATADEPTDSDLPTPSGEPSPDAIQAEPTTDPAPEPTTDPAPDLTTDPAPEPATDSTAEPTPDQADPEVPTAPLAVHEENRPEDEPAPELSEAELQGAVEAILLVVDEPTTEIILAQILEQPTGRVTAMLEKLARDYTDSGRGFELRRVAGGWRLYTRPEYAAYVEKFVLDGQQVRLTQAALETLAVVAYKQPVSRSRISAIRGVNCDGVVRTLVARGLIEECGSEPESGAFLYRTTTLFLEKLGLDGVDQLPPLAPFLPDDIDEIADAQR